MFQEARNTRSHQYQTLRSRVIVSAEGDLALPAHSQPQSNTSFERIAAHMAFFPKNMFLQHMKELVDIKVQDLSCHRHAKLEYVSPPIKTSMVPKMEAFRSATAVKR